MKRIRARYKDRYRETVAMMYHTFQGINKDMFKSVSEYLDYYDSHIDMLPYLKRYQIIECVLDYTVFDGDGDAAMIHNFVKRQLEIRGVYV